MKSKHSFLAFLFVIISLGVQAQQDSTTKAPDLIRWMTLQEAEQKSHEFAKAVLIFLHTDWCGWCKKMEAETFSNPDIAGYINVNFYPVKLNAETHDSIRFLDSLFVNPNPGVKSAHNIARMLAGDKLSYPTLVFYNDNFRFKLVVPGFKTISEIEPFLVYTTEYVFKTTAVEKFTEYYQKAMRPDTLAPVKDSIRWLSVDEGLAKLKEQPKKLLIMINTKWCNSGRVMRDATFKDSLIVKLTNELFYPVYFDAESKDTVHFKGIEFVNNGKMGTFHSFAISLCNGKLVLPSVIYIDTNLDLISAVPQFYSPEDMEYILNYFGKDHYRTQTWEEFKASFAPQIKP